MGVDTTAPALPLTGGEGKVPSQKPISQTHQNKNDTISMKFVAFLSSHTQAPVVRCCSLNSFPAKPFPAPHPHWGCHEQTMWWIAGILSSGSPGVVGWLLRKLCHQMTSLNPSDPSTHPCVSPLGPVPAPLPTPALSAARCLSSHRSPSQCSSGRGLWRKNLKGTSRQQSLGRWGGGNPREFTDVHNGARKAAAGLDPRLGKAWERPLCFGVCALSLPFPGQTWSCFDLPFPRNLILIFHPGLPKTGRTKVTLCFISKASKVFS